MRVALVETTSRAKVYPIALLKIGAMLKDLGHECQLFRDTLPPAGEFDEIWVTTLFTFDIPHAVGIVREAKKRADCVCVGGVAASLFPERFEAEGVEVHRGLYLPAENVVPDYSLLGYDPEYSITYASRGCIRKCKFCMVPKLEPEFEEVTWEGWLHPSTTKVQFFDNNWLAKPEKGWLEDVAKLHELVQAGRITNIDFNQGLDARLVTKEIASKLAGLPINPIRFAFDGMHEDGHFQRAIEMMAANGFRLFRSYVLFNFKDRPKDLYYRLRESVRLARELKIYCESFPMRFQPVEQADEGRKYIGEHWTEKERNAFGSLKARWSVRSGMIAPRSMEEFEYWMGDSAEAFVKLLNYPKLTELLNAKTGEVRIARANGYVPWGVRNDRMRVVARR